MIYTKTGDGGDTGVFSAHGGSASGGGASRVSKTSPVIEALGVLDEINSLLGVCKMKCIEVGHRDSQKSDIGKLSGDIGMVQQALFVVQAEVAGAPKELPDHCVLDVEKKIDAIEKQLPPITSFLVAGGTELSAMLDYARAVSRRAERRVVSLKDSGGKISPASLHYMNRLSSLLYALSRIVNAKSGITEEKPTY